MFSRDQKRIKSEHPVTSSIWRKLPKKMRSDERFLSFEPCTRIYIYTYIHAYICFFGMWMMATASATGGGIVPNMFVNMFSAGNY